VGLKGGPGRPIIKPSGMERGTEPKPPGSSGHRKRPGGAAHGRNSRSMRNGRSKWRGHQRFPIPRLHELRGARMSRAAPCQQTLIVEGALSTRDPAAHQRIGERHPLPRDQAQAPRRYPQRNRSPLPRRLLRHRQDLRPSSTSRSGITSVQDWRSRVAQPSHPWPNWSWPDPGRH
jgi:hypothetical protein